jgi:hypothetical protein
MKVSGQVAIGVTLLALAQPLPAQDQKADRPLLDALAACLDIPGDRERLACTDVAARRLVDASRRNEIVLVDREEVKKTRKSLFGFPLPNLRLFGKGGTDDDADEIDQLDAKIVQAAQVGAGRYSIAVEGGARWMTTEPWKGTAPPAPGMVLTIKRGALGSYFVKVGKYGAVRATRIG